MTLRGVGALLASLSSAAVLALDVVAEAEAPIVNDDLVLARQTALRRAMANAAEQEESLVQSSTLSSAGGAETRTSLTPRRQALGVRVLSEQVVRGRLRLSAEVTLSEPGRAASCSMPPLRKTLVTAFPLLYPEQVKLGEYPFWPQTTGEELARFLNGRGKLLTVANPGLFPFVSSETAPEVERKSGQPLTIEWARRARAQYVIAGLVRDFGVAQRAFVIPERQMAIEAFIYDGISGDLVARRQFSRPLLLNTELPKRLNPGTQEFRGSRLGEAYYELLAEIGQWAERSLGCLPFSARVVRVEGRTLYLDVGSDSGLEPGHELVLAQQAATVATSEGEPLPGERSAVAGAVVRRVHPGYSTAELAAKKNPAAVRVGDVLYGL